ncbi:hypothetical protein [Fulvivirga sedimenti]|uniref:Uncharacterized protein n=1 Tax=Fulvivirga sedimenti TaxID=2879465 RepID=A0A9X1HVL2_9BACT|nr:hypothetical protein [Fulvivirga sedimenti]MCA6079078.1 hypothetical protein [Fulvivirga sedimenti]
MKKVFCLFSVIFLISAGYGQEVRTYSDQITTLKIFSNGIFHLETVDPIFPVSGEVYQSEGNWIETDAGIRLNPQFEPRIPEVALRVLDSTKSDTLELYLDYSVTLYRENEAVSSGEQNFQIITIYINGKPYNLVRDNIIQHCAWAPKIRNQLVIGESNVVRIPVKRIKKFEVMTYGFEKRQRIRIVQDSFSKATLSIGLFVDEERMPRNRLVLVKNQNAYFYQVTGKPSKFLTPLQKIK